MEVKFNEATNNRPEGDRVIDAPLVLVDVQDYVAQLKDEKAWEKSDRNAITVFKSSNVTVVIVALHRKAQMTTERPENTLSVHVLKGKLKVSAGERVEEVNKNQIVALHENVPYQITALKKSVFILTVVE